MRWGPQCMCSGLLGCICRFVQACACHLDSPCPLPRQVKAPPPKLFPACHRYCLLCNTLCPTQRLWFKTVSQWMRSDRPHPEHPPHLAPLLRRPACVVTKFVVARWFQDNIMRFVQGNALLPLGAGACSGCFLHKIITVRPS